MVTTTPDDMLPHVGMPARASGLVTAGDRTAEFRRARRRTVIVRALRLALPTAALAVVAGYAVAIVGGTGLGEQMAELSIRKILPEDLAMNNPHYEGFGKDGSSYAFTARQARQDLATLNVIKLDGITGWVRQADRTKTDIDARRGTFNHEKSTLELFEEINVVSESGLKAKLTQATILTDESLLLSNQPVLVEFPSATIRSLKMQLRQKAKEVTFQDEVKARLTPPPPDPKKAPAPAPKSTSATSLFAPSSEPIDVAAERLDVNDVTKLAVFHGDVRAVQGATTLTSPELEITYSGDTVPGGASDKGEKSSGSALGGAAGKLSRIVAKGPVVITRGDTDVVTSDSADFDAAGEAAVLLGNVVMTSGADRRVTGDRVDLDQKADTALLTGSVVVLQGKNELRGRRLLVDRRNGKAQMTAPPGLGAGPGRVTARLYQGDGKAKAPDPAKEKAKALAAQQGQQGMGMASFKTDPTAPVDVDSDQLDVDETAKVAIFRGDVRAAQGDFVITSAELHAFYSGEAGLVDAGQTKPAEGKPAAKTELTRIEAKKNVFVSSTKGGQTATGDWANFDAKANNVVLGGDVVLTQGQNMVRGTRLVIDMASGESTIDTAPAKTVAKPQGGGWTTEQAPTETAAPAPANPGRASAVFYPQALKDAEAKKKAAAKPGQAEEGAATAPATSGGVDGWAATADPAANPKPGN